MLILKQELAQLKDQIIGMMQMVKAQLLKAKEAFLNKDGALAHEIIHYETRVNAIELSIDKECEKILLRFQPKDDELRFILAALKINTNLERLGDHAEGIAEFAIKIAEPYQKNILEDIHLETMFDHVLSMLDDAIYAFNFEKNTIARSIFAKDAIINEIEADSRNIIAKFARLHPDKLGKYLILFSTIRKLERCGDLIKNVAEETVFYIEAKVLRHHQKRRLN